MLPRRDDEAALMMGTASCRFCPQPEIGAWNSEPLPDVAPVWGDDGVRRPTMGDQVFITMATPHAPGAPMPDQGRDYECILGDGEALGAIEALVMQLAPGQTVEADVAWPGDFPDPQWHGVTKRLRITLREVRWAEDLLRHEDDAALYRRMTLADPYWRMRHANLAPDVLRTMQHQYEVRLRPDPERLIAAGIASDAINAPEDEAILFSIAAAYHARQRRRVA